MVQLNRCPETFLSLSYSYKKGCRCYACKLHKARYTASDTKAAERSRKWWKKFGSKRKRKLYAKRAIDKKYLLQRKSFGTHCMICGKSAKSISMSNSTRVLGLDHCHKSGKIRGLLCGNCNVGLGHFKDNIWLLYNAIIYLQKDFKENGDVY